LKIDETALNSDRQISPNSLQQSILDIYNKYAGMLLGYILKIVKDHKVAEKYMIDVFRRLAAGDLKQYNSENTWRQLQLITRMVLADFTHAIEDCEDYATLYAGNNRLIDRMDADQKNIFCAVYYHGKNTVDLAVQFNRPEDEIRKTLREAFATIRQNREH
jgi:hypothetical protein